MATDKAKRSNPLAQRARRRSNPQLSNPQLKAQLPETLHHLNRGYGIALANLERLDRFHGRQIFESESLKNFRNRTEELRVLANRELLQSLAGREAKEAMRFGRLYGKQERSSAKTNRPQ
ncbi:MAG: hypothetical protein ACXWSR_22490 [Bdellovibrionota bacterium]